jgi:hypothetical protein
MSSSRLGVGGNSVVSAAAVKAAAAKHVSAAA